MSGPTNRFMRELMRRFSEAIPEDDVVFDAEWFMHEQARLGVKFAQELGLDLSTLSTMPSEAIAVGDEVADPRMRANMQESANLMHDLMKASRDPS